MIRWVLVVLVAGACIALVILLTQRTYNDMVFFDLDDIEHHNAKIVMHVPTVVPRIYDFKRSIYSHYMTTVQVGNVAYIFYRDSNNASDAGNQTTMRITTTNGIDFSEPVEVFNIVPQTHNFAPFLKDGQLFAIAGGHPQRGVNLYNSKDNGLTWSFIRKLMNACTGGKICFDSLNVMVDDNIYGRQWNGNDREVHLYRSRNHMFSASNHIKIETSLRQLYTSGIFKYTDDMYVGVPMIFNGEHALSYTKLMYSKDGLKFGHFDDIWFKDDSHAMYARGGYVAPGIYKTSTKWYMYGLRNYGTSDIYMSALTFRPYGLTSVWSSNGYIKVRMKCDTCYANVKGYVNGVYVDSLQHEINCHSKILLENTHIFRLFC